MSLPIKKQQYVLWVNHIPEELLESSGRKATVLAKLSKNDITIPKTFIVLSDAFKEILNTDQLSQKIHHQIQNIDPYNPHDVSLASNRIQQLIINAEIPKEIGLQIINAYHQISDTSFVVIRGSKKDPTGTVSHQEPFFSIRGDSNVVQYIKKMWAKYFSSKFINTYQKTGQDINTIDLSIIVEHMINSNSSGITYTQPPDSINKNTVYINAIWGIRNEYLDSSPYPDLYTIEKNSLEIIQKEVIEQQTGLKQVGGEVKLTDIPFNQRSSQKLEDKNIIALTKISNQIQKLFFYPQKIEWAEINNQIFILDSQDINWNEKISHPTKKTSNSMLNNLKQIGSGTPVVPGLITAPFHPINHKNDLDKIKPNSIISIENNLLKNIKFSKISGIIIKNGSPINQETILIKDIGIPSIICQSNLKIKTGSIITLNSTTGMIYQGSLPAKTISLPKPQAKTQPVVKTATKLFVNLSQKSEFQSDLIDGVGILRSENIFNNLEFPHLSTDSNSQTKFINQLTTTINQIGSIVKDKPIFYRLSDNKEYGVLGLRGVSKHLLLPEVLKLETKSFIRAKKQNPHLHLLLPFIRNKTDIRKIKAVLADLGIKRSQNLKLWIMAEVPSCILTLKECLDAKVDGVVIGLNDLTMLTLGVDRNEAALLEIYNQKHLSLQKLIKKAIQVCNQQNIPCILAGENINLHPDIIEKAIKWGINGFSVSPESLPITKTYIQTAEKKLVDNKKIS